MKTKRAFNPPLCRRLFTSLHQLPQFRSELGLGWVDRGIWGTLACLLVLWCQMDEIRNCRSYLPVFEFHICEVSHCDVSWKYLRKINDFVSVQSPTSGSFPGRASAMIASNPSSNPAASGNHPGRSRWGFPKMMVPPNHPFYRVFHYKPSIFGVYLFLETPRFIQKRLPKFSGPLSFPHRLFRYSCL